ncbi:hypothetical protein ACFYXH_33130 [Streptomyces sp. NPDC002730]|uniref:hypothetical protein n=1 Tax=Streptomyces sp. NPDC002730 TaxID=3364662 RepID=UPI0036AEBE5B
MGGFEQRPGASRPVPAAEPLAQHFGSAYRECGATLVGVLLAMAQGVVQSAEIRAAGAAGDGRRHKGFVRDAEARSDPQRLAADERVRVREPRADPLGVPER